MDETFHNHVGPFLEVVEYKPVCNGDIALVYDVGIEVHVQSGNGCTVLKCPVQHFFP